MFRAPMSDFDQSEQSAQSSPDGPSGGSGALARMRSIARRGRSRLRGALRRRLDEIGERIRRELLEVMSSPQKVRRLQRVLANLAGWMMGRGFRADPNAELLFEFVDWLDDRHGRQSIAAIVFQSAMVRDPEFLEAMGHLSNSLAPWRQSADDSWSASRIDGFKRRAGNRLLSLLNELAALEADDPPPTGDIDDRIHYFEQAPIPDRFTRLAAMTRGDRLFERTTPSKRLGWAVELFDDLRPESAERSALSRFIPGRGDEQLHFLVLSTTFFLQSYLLRNLIEGLPDIARRLSDELRDDEIIEID